VGLGCVETRWKGPDASRFGRVGRLSSFRTLGALRLPAEARTARQQPVVRVCIEDVEIEGGYALIAAKSG
jgi:hypothetical protein